MLGKQSFLFTNKTTGWMNKRYYRDALVWYDRKHTAGSTAGSYPLESKLINQFI